MTERTLIQAAMLLYSGESAIGRLVRNYERLLTAVEEHHRQKGDDLCWLDDQKLYKAAGLPPRDCRVGDKQAMLENCKRYIELRCHGGGPWKTYEELLTDNETLRQAAHATDDRIHQLEELVRHCWVHSGYRDCGSEQMTTEQKGLYRSIIERDR